MEFRFLPKAESQKIGAKKTPYGSSTAILGLRSYDLSLQKNFYISDIYKGDLGAAGSLAMSVEGANRRSRTNIRQKRAQITGFDTKTPRVL
jgi:hypothetical protein